MEAVMAAEKHYFQFFNKLLVLIAVALSFCIVACSGADGKDGIAGADGRDGRDGLAGINGKDGAPGADGKDAVVNLDSLADAIRKEISGSLWDSVKTAPNIDTVYKNLFDQAFGEAWMDSTRQAIIDSLYAESYMDSVNGDLFEKAFGKEWMDSVRQMLIDSLYAESYVDSVYKNSFDSAFSEAWLDSARQALIDSLKEADYDSLYNKLYDSVYSDIYRQSVIRTLYAEDSGAKDEIYGAYANQYSLMYKDYPLVLPNGDSVPMPFPVMIENKCDPMIETCNSRKVLVKSWISNFTDTATVSGIVDINDTLILSPVFHFDENKLYALSSPKQTIRQVQVYALENDDAILFYSESKPVTIHPMQVFGNELISENPAFPDIRPWIGAWVTPMSDSITKIINEVAQKLPDGQLMVYQKYDADATVFESSERVVQAVFEVLQTRNIKYVQNTGAASLGQKVNYPVETLRKKQGICLETAVLFASVLERLGYKTSVMLIPGHAFVGWLPEQLATPTFDDFNVIETTMIGDKNATFLDARLAGINRYYDPLGDESYDTEEVTNIPVWLVREIGIMPNNIP
jgi:hypothetical protein